jgi:hypothetical protein
MSKEQARVYRGHPENQEPERDRLWILAGLVGAGLGGCAFVHALGLDKAFLAGGQTQPRKEPPAAEPSTDSSQPQIVRRNLTLEENGQAPAARGTLVLGKEEAAPPPAVKEAAQGAQSAEVEGRYKGTYIPKMPTLPLSSFAHNFQPSFMGGEKLYIAYGREIHLHNRDGGLCEFNPPGTKAIKMFMGLSQAEITPWLSGSKAQELRDCGVTLFGYNPERGHSDDPTYQAEVASVRATSGNKACELAQAVKKAGFGFVLGPTFNELVAIPPSTIDQLVHCGVDGIAMQLQNQMNYGVDKLVDIAGQTHDAWVNAAELQGKHDFMFWVQVMEKDNWNDVDRLVQGLKRRCSNLVTIGVWANNSSAFTKQFYQTALSSR